MHDGLAANDQFYFKPANSQCLTMESRSNVTNHRYNVVLSSNTNKYIFTSSCLRLGAFSDKTILTPTHSKYFGALNTTSEMPETLIVDARYTDQRALEKFLIDTFGFGKTTIKVIMFNYSIDFH